MWGTSYSINDGKFELKGLTPTDTGLISKQDFLAREATIIQFEVTLMGNSPQDVILFNWDPKTFYRNSESDPGPIHIQIGGDASIIKVEQAELRFASPDNQAHKYAIEILKEGILAFFYDGQEIGKLPLPRQTIVNGKISFSGTGWIDNVLVITPTAINTPQPTTKPATK